MGFFDRKTENDIITKKKEVEEEETEEEEESTNEFYEMTVECENCNDETTFEEIPFGTTLKEYIKDEKCETCGCSLVQEKI